MKSLKQQMTTAVSLTLMAMAIAVCAPDQSLAQHRMRNGGSANARQGINVGLGDGSVRQRNNAPRRSSVGGKPFLMPIEDVFSWKNAPRRYGIGGSSGVPTDQFSLNLKAAKRNNVTINGGDGNDTIGSAKVQRQNKAGQSNLLDGNDGGIWRNTNARRNSAGFSEQTNSGYKLEFKDVLVTSYSKPKSNLTATTYGRGSFAKSRGKRGH